MFWNRMRDKYMSVLWRQGGRAVYDILVQTM